MHDTAFGPPLAANGKRKLLPLGDPRATEQLFVPADPEPMMRVHDFKRKGGARGISREILEAQFRAAGFARKKQTPPMRPAPGTKLGQ